MMKKYLPKVPFYLLMVMILLGVFNYLTQSEMVIQAYVDLGFPVWTYYFNLTAKILGVLALVIPQVPAKIKDYAWAGLLYVLLMAIIGHVMVQDGQFVGAVIGLVLWILATIFGYGINKE